jgi:hypothetical protein
MRPNTRLAQLWLDALATELGAAAGTIDTYTDDLNCYLAWLQKTAPDWIRLALSKSGTTSLLWISAATPDRPLLDASPSFAVFIAS